MEEESQMEIHQNVVNGCLCVLGLCELFLVFYILTNLHVFLLQSKRCLFLKKMFFLAVVINVFVDL